MMSSDLCLQELILGLNTDVAEFCTVPHNYNWLAVGTYQLDEATRERHGRLHLYSLASSSQTHGQLALQLAATLDMPGIFDLQWTQLPNVHDKPFIGLALADGSLQLLAVADAANASCSHVHQAERGPGQTTVAGSCNGQQERPAAELQQLCSCKAVSEGMALALDWNPQQHQGQGAAPLAAVSSSSGGIAVLQVTPTAITPLLEWQGHDLEAWMATWDKHQANVLYSGADDSTFKGWDMRCATAVSSSSTSGADSQQQQQQSAEAAPLFSNRRAHGAGVCCISSHPKREHVLMTGSYDEAARLWDVRMLQRPVQTCQVATGGGVWRLKWHPRQDNLLLAACMYNGVALLEVDEAWSQLKVVEEYKGHDSIAYGADWYRGCWPAPRTTAHTGSNNNTQQDDGPAAASAADAACAAAADAAADALAGLELGSEQQGGHKQQQQQQQQPPGALQSAQRRQQDIIATCSFYDRRLHLWSPKHTAGSC